MTTADLPLIDEHSVIVDTEQGHAWSALQSTLWRLMVAPYQPRRAYKTRTQLKRLQAARKSRRDTGSLGPRGALARDQRRPIAR